jgi:predicted ArsR family transcriptional regulator
MKKKIPEIKESVEELKEKLKIEKSPRSQQRVHMLYLLKSGEAKSRQEVADLLAVHRHTVGQWLSRYEQEGMEGMLELKTKPNRAYSLSAEEKEKWLAPFPLVTGRAIKKSCGIWQL